MIGLFAAQMIVRRRHVWAPGWLVLGAQGGPFYAATVIGAVYAGAGLLLWAVALGRGRADPPKADPQQDPYGPSSRWPKDSPSGWRPAALRADPINAGPARRAPSVR